MSRASAVLVLTAAVTGCGEPRTPDTFPDASVDASIPLPETIELVLGTSYRSDFEPIVRIQGQQATSRRFVLDRFAYRSDAIHIDVFHPETERHIERFTWVPLCLRRTPYVVRETGSFFISEQGQLHRASDTCLGSDGHNSIGDWGVETCAFSGYEDCYASSRCGLELAHEEPTLYHFACLPEGDVELGGACEYLFAGPGSYDTCTRGSGCIEGVCQKLCGGRFGDACPEAEVCLDVDGAGHGHCAEEKRTVR